MSSEREGLRTLNLIETEHVDPHHQQASWPPRSKVARSRHASDRCWPIRRERNVLETLKIGRKVTHPTGNNAHHFQGQRSRSRGRLMLRPEVRYIFRTERSTNFKLCTQMEHEDPYRREAPPRLKVKVAMSRGASDRCWPISRVENEKFQKH